MNTDTPNWLTPDKIHEYPQLHSSAADMRPLLIVLDRYDTPQIGYYYAGLLNEWRLFGSPSEWTPEYWMPMPAMPNEN